MNDADATDSSPETENPGTNDKPEDANRIAREILRLAEACAPGRSFTPEEVARALSGPDENWQRLLSPVRRAAQHLAASDRIEILRKGKPVPPAELRGVIRLRHKQADN